MNYLSENIIAPIRCLQTRISSFFPFSLAELFIAILVAWVIYMIIRRKWKGLLTWGCTITLMIYAGFCILWGTYYYGTPAPETEMVAQEDLVKVTQYFATLCNESYVSDIDRDEVIEKSDEVFSTVKVKKILCSKVMSYIDFSGFFFPFTGEANVNMDMPAHDLPSTVAHELAHLQGVPTEQEANFQAVKGCLEYGEREYVYSAALSAYTYLGNALYKTDYDSWETIYKSLDENVLSDLLESNSYWEKFDTPVREASNTVYENFLYSYGQELGLQSYGACVDLLVNYYKDKL